MLRLIVRPVKNSTLFANRLRSGLHHTDTIISMKKRDLFLLASFVLLFLLFAMFQNFSFPNKHLHNLTNKNFYKKNLHKFVPNYYFNKDNIGGGVEVPHGYKEDIQRRIASADSQIIFDRKRFIQEAIEGIPLYNDIQDLISDVAFAEEPGDVTSECVASSAEAQGVCVRSYSSLAHKEATEEDTIKFRANPLRQTASISFPGEIYSQVNYDGDNNRVSVQFSTNISRDAGVRVELDTLDQSGKINIDLNW